MNISFDIDGVLANFTSNVIPVINEIFTDRMPIPQSYNPIDWYWTDVMRKQDWDPVFARIKEIPDFWFRQEPYPEAVKEARIFLHSYPDEIKSYFITARMDTGGVGALDQTCAWLEKYKLMTGTVFTVKDPVEKQRIMKDRDIEFSVDDKMETVRDAQLLKNHRAFIYNQPWNQDVKWLPRVHSIKEYANHVVEKLMPWYGNVAQVEGT